MAYDFKTHGLQYRSTRITIPYGFDTHDGYVLQSVLKSKAGRVNQEQAQKSTKDSS